MDTCSWKCTLLATVWWIWLIKLTLMLKGLSQVVTLPVFFWGGGLNHHEMIQFNVWNNTCWVGKTCFVMWPWIYLWGCWYDCWVWLRNFFFFFGCGICKQSPKVKLGRARMAHGLQGLILFCFWHGLEAAFPFLLLLCHWNDSHLILCISIQSLSVILMTHYGNYSVCRYPCSYGKYWGSFMSLPLGNC